MRWYACLGVILSLQSVGDVSEAEPATPDWLVVRIGRVQVKAVKVDGKTWDLNGDSQSKGDCAVLGAVGGATLGPAAGAIVTHICSSNEQSEQERDATAPDLFVQLAVGETKFRTSIAADTFSEVFDYKIIIPVAAIPSAGLELQVLDQDRAVSAGELIGVTRLFKSELLQAIADDRPVITLADAQVEKLEVEVERYEAFAGQPPFRFETNQDPMPTRTRVRAGELITVKARGHYRVSNVHAEIGVEGYPDPKRRSFNRKPDFAKVNHAAAIAYVGSTNGTRTSLYVGSCVAAVSPVAGALFVGVNDSDVGNNSGLIEFDVALSLPTLEQWRGDASTACAPSSVTEGEGEKSLTPPHASPKPVLSKVISAYMGGIKRCYRDSLAKNPDLAGSVTLTMTVTEKGRTAMASATGFPDPSVNTCITGIMQSWRFSHPKDAAGAPTFATYSLKMDLTP